LTSENCERDKRKYTKSTNEYWSDTIFKQRAAEKANISEEMLLVADKYSEIEICLILITKFANLYNFD
jgi:hypothetical protein